MGRSGIEEEDEVEASGDDLEGRSLVAVRRGCNGGGGVRGIGGAFERVGDAEREGEGEGVRGEGVRAGAGDSVR